jgi:hypothetical protein
LINFDNIEYLKSGNSIQRKAYTVLQKSNIFSRLSEFTPILVGTIPIDINIESSDLDIICYWQNKDLFINTVYNLFHQEQDFQISEKKIGGQISVIANFIVDEFELEIFGQNIPTKLQNGFRHMMIEYNLLEKNDSTFRQAIIQLKKQGLKTEPAFAKLLGLEGNPYVELLKYEV